MLVGKRMKRNPITVDVNSGIKDALKLLQVHRIRHLPVMDGKRMVGIITDRDIRRVLPSPATSLEIHELNYLLDKLQVGEVMTKKVVTVDPQTTLEEAAKLLLDYRIGGLPVLEGNELVGIITETDILEAFLEVMGVLTSSSRIELVVEDRPGALEEVCRIIKEHKGNVLSVVTARAAHLEEEKKVLVIRLEAVEFEPLIKALEGKGYMILSSLV